MDAPRPSDLVRLRADLRATGAMLLAAGAATILLAVLRAPPDLGWLAWAVGSLASWSVAFVVLTRRRLAAAAAGARRLGAAAAGEDRLRPSRGRMLWLLVLAGCVAAAGLGGFTHVAAGILLAAAATALTAARWTSDLESRLGGALYVDRRGRLRGRGPLDPRNLWLGGTPPDGTR